MEIDYDPAKDRNNRRKHGLPLSDAARFDWDTALIEVDDRFDYDELRMMGLGLIGADVFHISFVERGDMTRIISLRPAQKHEIKRYVHHLEGRYKNPHAKR